MGQAISQQLHPNTNQNFLKMIAFPSENKLVTTACIRSPAELSSWASNLLKISNIKGVPILMPQQFKTISRYPCSDQSLLQVTYECYYINFEDEINKRTEEEKHFQQEELWYLLFTLVEAADISHHFQSNLGDIKPSNLLLNKEGQIKVLSKMSVPSFLDSFSQQNPKTCLFSPQQLQDKRKSFRINKRNYIISQSFSIGITLLAAGALSKVSSLYNYQQYTLNLIEFNKLIKYWHQFYFYSEPIRGTVEYSKQLKEIILRLVEIQPTKRLTSIELYQILLNYKQQILGLEKFIIDGNFLKVRGNSAHQSTKTHRLQSRRRSEGKDSLKSSILVPSFNNSHDMSFQNIGSNSPLLNETNSKQVRSQSHKKKLSITYQKKGEG